MTRPSDPREELLGFARASMWICMVMNACFVLAAYGQIDDLDLTEDIDLVWQAMAVFGFGLVLAFGAIVTRRFGRKWETTHLALTLGAPIVFFVGFVFAIYATIGVA